jgi:hypothetical protein
LYTILMSGLSSKLQYKVLLTLNPTAPKVY